VTDQSPTAVVRREPRPADAPPPADTPYRVLFTATLVPPYSVELADPVEIQMRQPPALMVWAQHTSVPYEWLRTGSWPSEAA